jgi:hypothetical protein
MMMKFLSPAVGAALLALASAANAGQPMQLSDNQMDVVTAGANIQLPGGVALANAAALALGEVTADTKTQTSTNVSTAGLNPLAWIAIGQSASTAVAAGGFLFDAGAVAHSDSTASLPGL